MKILLFQKLHSFNKNLTFPSLLLSFSHFSHILFSGPNKLTRLERTYQVEKKLNILESHNPSKISETRLKEIRMVFKECRNKNCLFNSKIKYESQVNYFLVIKIKIVINSYDRSLIIFKFQNSLN